MEVITNNLMLSTANYTVQQSYNNFMIMYNGGINI